MQQTSRRDVLHLVPLRRVMPIAALGLFGALLGGWLSWRLAVSLAQERMASTSVAMLAEAAELDREVVSTVTRFDRQPDEFCSAGEFAQMRYVVFATRYVKDILRVRGDQACAAILQAMTSPPRALAADAITTLGELQVSPAETLLLLGDGVQAPVIAGRETRIALDPAAFHAAPAGTSIAYRSADGAKMAVVYGAASVLSADDWRAGASIERDGTLFSPRCARDRPICVDTHQAKASVFAAQWPMLAMSTLFGGVAWGAMGIAVSMWSLRRRALDVRLRRAIANGQLEVAYQPIVRIRDRAVVGAEALVRWHEGDGRSVPPSRFIPLAEDMGCIGAITLFVVQRVAGDFGDALRAPTGFHVNVNLSAHDLGDTRLQASMTEVLDAARIDRRRIGLELTEHSLADREVAVAGTRRLSELGHPIHVDDFGTGYSSLSTLGDLHVDVLKIDRAFTSTIGTGAMKVSLVPQIVQLARTLGLAVVVEGVETEAQHAYLQQFGDDLLAQGWLYGQPMTAAAFHAASTDAVASAPG